MHIANYITVQPKLSLTCLLPPSPPPILCPSLVVLRYPLLSGQLKSGPSLVYALAVVFMCALRTSCSVGM